MPSAFTVQVVITLILFNLTLGLLLVLSRFLHRRWITPLTLWAIFAMIALLALALAFAVKDQPLDLSAVLPTLLLILLAGLALAGLRRFATRREEGRQVTEETPPAWQPPGDDQLVWTPIDESREEYEKELGLPPSEQRPSPWDDSYEKLHQELVTLLGGNVATADRLIQYERDQVSGLSDEEYVQHAIKRLENDRRSGPW